MKIDKSVSPLPKSLVESTNSGSTKTVGNVSSGSLAASTSVTLGAATSRLRDLENSAANAPVVDSNKVAEIKKAISEGRFQVNSGVVADRLINTVQNLINASKR